MFEELFNELNIKKEGWVNEAEVRKGWIFALQNALNVEFDEERSRRDASYNNVVIEFKDKGLFRGRENSTSFKQAINKRLLPYIIRIAQEQGQDQSDYIGIAIDGEHISFAQVKNSAIEHGPLLPISPTSVTMVAIAIRDNYRRPLDVTSLIKDFGHSSNAGVQMMQSLANALSKNINEKGINKTKMLFEEWQTLFGQVADLSIVQEEEISRKLKFKVNIQEPLKQIPCALFVIHTYNSLIIKLLAAEIISAHKLLSTYHFFAQNLSVEIDSKLLERLDRQIEKGEFYSSANIKGFVEEALFSWYIDACNIDEHKNEITAAIREILVKLSFYRTDNLTQARSKDLLKIFYQNLVPEVLRKSLGEFYTPDWLVDFTLQKAGPINWLKNKTLDPTCGSGSFLIEVIKRKLEAARDSGLNPKDTIKHVTTTVWGFDLNPLAVQTARVNFLIYIADLLTKVPGTVIEIPVLLADAIYSPAKDPNENEDIVNYVIGSKIANLEIILPSKLALNRVRLDFVFEILGESIEDDLPYVEAEKKLIKAKALTKDEAHQWKVPIQTTYDNVLKLHANNWNGIWFRIIRNFFWSATAGRFNLIAGNPPWVRWSKLPELYRERVKPTCLNYNIFSTTPHHGGNELDISGMITYTVADKWLETGGLLAFIIPQIHFQSPSSEGFRDFKINDIDVLMPLHVDDLKELKPFPDAINKTSVALFKKATNEVPVYPISYTVWQSKTGNAKTIPANYSLTEVLNIIEPISLEANPVSPLRPNSPWAILPIGRFEQMQKLTGKCDWVQGRKGITADLNGIYFVEIADTNDITGQVKIKIRPDAGKKDIGPAKTFWVEPDLLFPLVKGASDFSRCYFHRIHNLYVFVPNTGINRQAYSDAIDLVENLRNTKKFFASYKGLLENRSTYRGRMKLNGAPYYALYNVGEYTFAPYKVIWAEQKDFCSAVVSSDEVPLIGPRVFIPDHKLFFVDFHEKAPAYFLCGLLNSEIVIEWVKSHNISIQIGDIFKHMNLPEYNSKMSSHKKLVRLTESCHEINDLAKRTKVLSQISALALAIIDGTL